MLLVVSPRCISTWFTPSGSVATNPCLADFLDLENGMVVTLHIQSIDQSAAIKTIKRKLTDIDKSGSQPPHRR